MAGLKFGVSTCMRSPPPIGRAIRTVDGLVLSQVECNVDVASGRNRVRTDSMSRLHQTARGVRLDPRCGDLQSRLKAVCPTHGPEAEFSFDGGVSREVQLHFLCLKLHDADKAGGPRHREELFRRRTASGRSGRRKSDVEPPVRAARNTVPAPNGPSISGHEHSPESGHRQAAFKAISPIRSLCVTMLTRHAVKSPLPLIKLCYGSCRS